MSEWGPFLFIRYRLSGGWSFFIGRLGIHWNPSSRPRFAVTF